jgi:small-conductance mechanosensitive channel
MPREKFREKPFLYKLFTALLRITSGMVILLVIFFAVRFLMETPFYRMFDGISVAQIVMMALVLVAVICFFVAWRNAFAGGIATIFPVIGYTLIDSIEQGVFSAGAINYIMFSISLLFIIQGLVKKHIEHDRMEEIMGPKIDKNDGPDLTNLHL